MLFINPLVFILFIFLWPFAIAGGDEQRFLFKKSAFHPLVSAYYSYLSLETFLKNASGTYLPRLPTPYNGLGFTGGFKYGQYVGLQIGYAYYFGLHRRTQVNNVSYSIFMRPEIGYADIVGYYPVSTMNGLSVEGSAGVIANDFSFFMNNLTQGGESYTNSVNLNLHLGLGLSYLFARNWVIYALYHFMPNHISNREAGGWKTAWTVDLGFGYEL